MFGIERGKMPAGRSSGPESQAADPGAQGDALSGLGPTHELTARIVAELKQARRRLEKAVPAGSALSPAIRALWRTERRLDRPLRLAICGEFNSGKSSLANLLARIESLPTAVLSNTRIPTLLYHAREPEIWAVHESGRRERLRADRAVPSRSILRLDVGLPSARLRAVQILDLPGLADPGFHAPLANLPIYDVDAVLWCTMSTQAWKESERAAWSQLSPRLRSRGLLVATHADLLHSSRDAGRLLARLRSEASALFCNIVLMSTAEALALMRDGGEGSVEAWKATGAQGLETALHQLLARVHDQRVEAALEVTGRIAHRALAHIEKGQAEASPEGG